MASPGQHELYRIREDRGQKHDVALEYPEVVEELLAQYDAHWESLDIYRPLQRPIMSRKATLRLSTAEALGVTRIEQHAVPERGGGSLEVVAGSRGRRALPVRSQALAAGKRTPR